MSSELAKRTKVQGFEAVTINRAEIKNAPYNPRSITNQSRARLKKSLQKHKLVETVVWNKQTGNLVGGHQRLSLIDDIEGGQDYSITVAAIDVPAYQEKALNVMLNNHAAQGQFDHSLLQDIMGDLIANDIDVTDTGYTMHDLQLEFPDVFLTGEQQEQLEAERDIVAEAHEMKEAGKEFEAGFRERMGLPPQNKDKKIFMPDIDAGIDEANSEAAGMPDREPEFEPKAVGEEDRGWKESKEHFQQRRKEVTEQNHQFATQSNVFLTLAFRNEEQLKFFMQRFDIPESVGYTLDEFQINASFGVELP